MFVRQAFKPDLHLNIPFSSHELSDKILLGLPFANINLFDITEFSSQLHSFARVIKIEVNFVQYIKEILSANATGSLYLASYFGP